MDHSFFELNMESLKQNKPDFYKRISEACAAPPENSEGFDPDKQLSEKLFAEITANPKHHFIYVGIRAGIPAYFFEKLKKQKIHYILAENAEAVAAAFSRCDYRDMIESENVFFFEGYEAINELSDVFEKKAELGVIYFSPGVIFCMEEQNTEERESIQAAVSKIIDKAYEFHLRKAAFVLKTYKPPSVKEVAAKYASGTPLRILGLIYENTQFLKHSMRDIIQSVTALGHKTIGLSEGKCRFYTGSFLLSALKDIRPDIVICHGAFGMEWISKILKTIQQPSIYWFFDNPRFFLNEETVREIDSPHSAVFGLLPKYAEEFAELGLNKPVPTVGLGINENTFRPVPPDSEILKKYAHDIAYVGNIRSMDEVCSIAGDHIGLEKMIEIIEFIKKNIDSIFTPRQAVEQYLSTDFNNPDMQDDIKWHFEIATQALREINRLAFLGAMDPKLITTYGQGWENYPGFGTHMGPIANGPDLAALCQSAKIMLHIHELTIAHPRVMECLASGGFVMARRTPTEEDTEDFLVDGSEIITFTTRDDFRNKVDHYLSHPMERREISAAGRKRILRDFTYGARLKKILDATMESWGA